MAEAALTGEQAAAPPAPPRPLVPTGVLGMILVILVEIMFFAAFISAHTINSAKAPLWPPLNQPRLPIWSTAINTTFLLLSGVVMWVAHRRYNRDERRAPLGLLALAIALGALFVVLQGTEWVRLLNHGLTLQSSNYGAYFYVIIGAHALHVIAGLLGLGWLWTQLRSGRRGRSAFWAGETFWYFVVGVWPVLYWVVYMK